jgi:release factor glutamine methyltransferase
MLTLLEIIKRTADFLEARGVENARLNAEHLVGQALGLKRMQLYLQFEKPLGEAELERIRPLVRRRGLREPLQHIVGEVEFAGLRLRSDRRALVPRPETEYLTEILLSRLPEAAPLRVLDLGTGTGAIALSLAAARPAWQVSASDLSADALALARENAAALGLTDRVTFLEGSWFGALPPEARFDLIVSNPPYLAAAEVAEAAPEVREYDPRMALVSDDEGLADLRALIHGALSRLGPGGVLALETGPAQPAALTAVARTAGWTEIESLRDLTGRDRFLLLHAAALPEP